MCLTRRIIQKQRFRLNLQPEFSRSYSFFLGLNKLGRPFVIYCKAVPSAICNGVEIAGGAVSRLIHGGKQDGAGQGSEDGEGWC